ncbi:MAG TPA: acyl carrier protein [Myxococcales bacterium]|nr:acyl carrier protein [Myxococcales bacterium]
MPPPSPADPASSPPGAPAPGEGELREQALAEIRRILVEELAVVSAVEPGQALVGDLHLDSMELITLAVGLENRFRVKLSEADSTGVSTAGDLAALVARRALASGAPAAEKGAP